MHRSQRLLWKALMDYIKNLSMRILFIRIIDILLIITITAMLLFVVYMAYQKTNFSDRISQPKIDFRFH